MAKKVLLNSIVWEPPPPTRAEALRPDYIDDGARDLDQMVSDLPLDPPSEWQKMDMRREDQKEQIRETEFQQSRRFEIDINNKTGR